ncbi:MAG: TIM barrel protein, partial [Clostridia bacterium]|nr:TIM barrel protein [Clostridia bacterium]
MKFSFSTRGWHDHTFDEFLEVAHNLKFDGVELHNVYNRLFTDKNGAFHDYSSASTMRKLYENKLSIPCIDCLTDISNSSKRADAIDEITRCQNIALNLKIPFVRIKSVSLGEDAYENAKSLIAEVLPSFEETTVALLLETSGIFADTAVLRQMMDEFASDNLLVLWNTATCYFQKGETAETVIKNLGAYVSHVQITDGKKTADGIDYCLVGEGELPIADIMLALRSVNYNGYISLVWDPKWCEDLSDLEIILSQFINYMKEFNDTKKNETVYYYNKTHTGKFLWKKELLIDLTFPQVLDRMVEEFPDQYAFKYTTLDYTRTYSEFRDDVDEFARSLIALGVKP